MKVSILMPWRETDERRLMIREWVEARWQSIMPAFQFCEGHAPDGPFNRAAALNDAASKATGDAFLVVDADTAVNQDALAVGLDLLKDRQKYWVLPYVTYYNLTETATDLLMSYPPASAIPEPWPGAYEYRLTDSVSGIVMLRREAWEAVNGFDARFVGWGGEDRAFQRALEVLWGPCVRIPSYVVHLWHHAPESVRFQNANWPANEALMRRYQQAGRDEMEQLVLER